MRRQIRKRLRRKGELANVRLSQPRCSRACINASGRPPPRVGYRLDVPLWRDRVPGPPPARRCLGPEEGPPPPRLPHHHVFGFGHPYGYAPCGCGTPAGSGHTLVPGSASSAKEAPAARTARGNAAEGGELIGEAIDAPAH